jgi:uncharacterized membrane protein YdbT with pleckstrin-like domain
MSYVDSNLLPGEQVVARAHLHKIVFLWPVVLAVLGLAFHGVNNNGGSAGNFFLLLALISGCVASVRYFTSEFAVTDKRVIVKVGVLRRRSLELLRSKIEGIVVDQGLLGRMVGYGTLVVTGTGGTKESFKHIAGPFEFRRAVQAEAG